MLLNLPPVPELAFQAVLGEDLSSWAISRYGQAYGGFSHIDCILPQGLIGARSDVITVKDEKTGVEMSIPPGVQLRPFKYEKWKRRAVMKKKVTVDVFIRWRDWLLSQRGHQYDEGAILDFILGRRDLSKPGRFICSALATGSLEKVGECLSLPVPSSQVTPNGFCLIACARGFSYQEK